MAVIKRKKLGELILGRPLMTDEASHQSIGKGVALAVFASDALSSVAYATQEILIVLAGAATIIGAGVYGYSIPIAAAIVFLLAILTISYRQTIFAYPGGGGAYIVARDNIGELPAQIAGAALLTDYVLTVAVSISSGVDQVASAIPALKPVEAPIAIVTIIFMAVINLRGVKESGRVFAIPTYFFVVMMFITLIVGFYRYFSGSLGVVTGVEVVHQVIEPLGILLILRAFSSGCAAVTGVEAISNGITAFKDPKSKNAATTMTIMSSILGVTFLSITFLANRIGAVPSEVETVISQLGRTVYGPGPLYGLLIASTTVILIMAANTSFADFPRLCALHAGDGFLPRQLTFRGGRLVFSWGILALAAASIVLVAIFNASTTALIPLYAIGVFLSFTLSQLGMVIRWQRISKLKPTETIKDIHSVISYDAAWRFKQIVNAVGATLSFVVMIVFTATKFSHGAYIIVILIPSMVFVFFRIHKHYKGVARMLSLSGRTVTPERHAAKMIVLIDDVHAGTVPMIEFAMSYGNNWTALHIDDNPDKTKIILAKWQQRMGKLDHPLHLIPAPYRDLTTPIVNYVQDILDKDPNILVHVVMGQLIMDTWAAQVLHANTSIRFKLALQQMSRVVVTDVAYPLHGDEIDHTLQREDASGEPSLNAVQIPTAMEPTIKTPMG